MLVHALRHLDADLLLAASALGCGLPLFTRNPDDFAGLDDLIDLHAI